MLGLFVGMFVKTGEAIILPRRHQHALAEPFDAIAEAAPSAPAVVVDEAAPPTKV